MKQLFVASILSVFLPIAVFAYVSPGIPTGYINDYANILQDGTETSLKSELESFKNTTGNEVVVVTINSLGGDSIENYAVKLFKEWGIGNKEKDTGVLLLISKDDRETRIEVGYGLEPVLTDIETANIIREILVPAFKNNDFDGGVNSAIQKIITDISNGSEVVPLNNSPIKGLSFVGKILSQSFYPFLILIMMLGSILGRSKSWWAGGIIGAGVGILIAIFSGLFAGIIGVIILVPLGLLFDYIVSKKGGGGTGGPFIFPGGGGGFNGGSSGGFGGFGGGMSGGGGSSGKW